MSILRKYFKGLKKIQRRSTYTLKDLLKSQGEFKKGDPLYFKNILRN